MRHPAKLSNILDPDQAKQSIIFSRKTNNIVHPPLNFSNAIVNFTDLGNLVPSASFRYKRKVKFFFF